MNKWFLIYCKPKQEKKAEDNLSRQGFTVFRPTINVITSKIGFKNSVKCESLFPRYLFIKVDPNITSISPVMSTFGVSSFVKFGDSYAIASEALIDDIKRNVALQTALVGSPEAIKNGDAIYVDGHGFDHVNAIYCNPCGSMRALILMNIMGKDTKLSVPTNTITKIKDLTI